MSTDIYLFLSDETFINMSSPTVTAYSNLASNGVGVIDENLLTYFEKHAVFVDPVGTSGVTSIRRNRLAVDRSLPQGTAIYGKMALHFDAVSNGVGRLVGNSVKYEDEIADAFVRNEQAADSEPNKLKRLASLFNIVELIFYSRPSESPANPSNLDSIEEALSSQLESGIYKGYVPNSLKLTNSTSSATVRYATSTDILVSSSRNFWNACSFDFTYENANNVTVTITFHIWSSLNSFKNNYPYSKCVDCILPCAPEYIVKPGSYKYASGIKAIVGVSAYTRPAIAEAVGERDHTGALIVSSRYTNNGYPGEYSLSFTVLYKGSTPSLDKARDYVRDYLLNTTHQGSDQKLASRDEWKSVLPDLFVDGFYLLVPMYSQLWRSYQSSALQRGIESFNVIYNQALRIIGALTSYTQEEILEKLEILRAPGNDLFIAAVPIGEETRPLKQIHTSYRAVDSQDYEAYGYITPASRDLAMKLSQAITLCLDSTKQLDGFTSQSSGTYRTIVFSAGGGAANEQYASFTVVAYNETDWS